MSLTIDSQLSDWRTHALKLEKEVNSVIVGQKHAIRLMNTAFSHAGMSCLTVV